MRRVISALFVISCLSMSCIAAGEEKPASKTVLAACGKTVAGVSCVRETGGGTVCEFGIGSFVEWNGQTGTYLLVHGQLFSDGVDNPRYSVYIAGAVRVARLETFDSSRRMSIIKLAEPVADAVALRLGATPTVQAGDELYLIYCLPQAFNYSIAVRAIVVSSMSTGKKGQELITDADVVSPALSGSTGGLVFRADGTLVGMLLSSGAGTSEGAIVCSHDYLSSVLSDMASAKAEVKKELKPSDKPCWFGALTSRFTPAVKAAMKAAVNVDYGVLISAVLTDSPAEKAKFKVMDLVTEVNGMRAIAELADLEVIFASLTEGSDISISYLRYNSQTEAWELKTKTVKGERRPQVFTETERFDDPFLKAEFAPLSWDLKIRTCIMDKYLGVYTTKVEDGILKVFGFPEGAVILKANNVNTPDIQSFRAAVSGLQKMSGKTVEFLVCMPDGYNRPVYRKILIP